jgi:hypothetical protein
MHIGKTGRKPLKKVCCGRYGARSRVRTFCLGIDMGCAMCGGKIDSQRSGKRYCTPRCRVAAWRSANPRRRRVQRRRAARLSVGERAAAADLAAFFV